MLQIRNSFSFASASCDPLLIFEDDLFVLVLDELRLVSRRSRLRRRLRTVSAVFDEFLVDFGLGIVAGPVLAGEPAGIGEESDDNDIAEYENEERTQDDTVE